MKHVLFAILLSFPLVGFSASLEFKGVPFGASEEKVKLVFPDATCKDRDDLLVVSDRQCDLSVTIANWLMYGFFSFYSDKLHSIDLYGNTNGFSDIASALVEKYGRPTRTMKEKLQNKMGARFTNEILIWKIGTDTIEARRYSYDLDTLRITYSTAFADKEYSRRIREKEKKAAKDL